MDVMEADEFTNRFNIVFNDAQLKPQKYFINSSFFPGY